MNTAAEPETRSEKPGRSQRMVGLLGLAPLWFVVGGLTLWAAAALYFDTRVLWLRTPLAAAYVAAVLVVWLCVRGRWLKWA